MKRIDYHRSPIIAVRPRSGSALNRVSLYARELGCSLADALHSWAEKNEDEITKRIKEEGR